MPLLTPFGMMGRNQTVSGVNLGHLWGRSDLLREELAALLDLWRTGDIRPRIDGVYPFAEAADERFRVALSRAIDGLPERERLVMSLYYSDGLNLKEIGAVLKVTESRVCQLHGQALVRLKARLADWRDGESQPVGQ